MKKRILSSVIQMIPIIKLSNTLKIEGFSKNGHLHSLTMMWLVMCVYVTIYTSPKGGLMNEDFEKKIKSSWIWILFYKHITLKQKILNIKKQCIILGILSNWWDFLKTESRRKRKKEKL